MLGVCELLMFQTGYSLHRLSSVLTAVAFRRFSEGPVVLQRGWEQRLGLTPGKTKTPWSS